MKFQFEKTKHFNQTQAKVWLISNRILGESYRYTFGFSIKNKAYHFSVFEIMPYEQCVDKATKEMIARSPRRVESAAEYASRMGLFTPRLEFGPSRNIRPDDIRKARD